MSYNTSLIDVIKPCVHIGTEAVYTTSFLFLKQALSAASINTS
jgi:hypothetical protein